MRRLLLLLLVPVLLLSACSQGNGESGDTTSAAPKLSDVKVSGEAGQAPKVTGVKGIQTKKIENAVAVEGKGATLADGDTVNVSYVLYGGKDGKQVSSTYDAGAPVALTMDKSKDKLLAGSLEKKKVGSRVVIAAPAVEFYGAENTEQAGVGKDETLILVTELVSKFEEPKTTGSIKDVSASGAFGKTPTVKAKKKLFVAKTESKTLSSGDGAKVKKGDKVTIRYHGVDGRTGKVFDSSYAKGKKATTADMTLEPNSVIPGFVTGLAGQKMGSRVLITIPYTEAYGASGSPDAGIEGGDTLIFVVDLVKKAK